jgi:hypothetical protein
VLEQRGNLESEAIYLRAHEVDDAVSEYASADPDDPMSWSL